MKAILDFFNDPNVLQWAILFLIACIYILSYTIHSKDKVIEHFSRVLETLLKDKYKDL